MHAGIQADCIANYFGDRPVLGPDNRFKECSVFRTELGLRLWSAWNRWPTKSSSVSHARDH